MIGNGNFLKKNLQQNAREIFINFNFFLYHYFVMENNLWLFFQTQLGFYGLLDWVCVFARSYLLLNEFYFLTVIDQQIRT